MKYAGQVKTPESFRDELAEVKGSKQELDLTTQLIKALTVKFFDLAEFHDVYEEHLQELIDAKVAGREIVAPPSKEAPPVINLMDALRKSMKQAISKSSGKSPRKRAQGLAPRRKSG